MAVVSSLVHFAVSVKVSPIYHPTILLGPTATKYPNVLSLSKANLIWSTIYFPSWQFCTSRTRTSDFAPEKCLWQDPDWGCFFCHYKEACQCREQWIERERKSTSDRPRLPFSQSIVPVAECSLALNIWCWLKARRQFWDTSAVIYPNPTYEHWKPNIVPHVPVLYVYLALIHRIRATTTRRHSSFLPTLKKDKTVNYTNPPWEILMNWICCPYAWMYSKSIQSVKIPQFLYNRTSSYK